MLCRSEIFFATPKYALPLRNMHWALHCHSEIYIDTPKYILPLRNISCYSEIYIATLKYALPLRNMHCYPEKKRYSLKFYLLTHSVPILRHMLCHSEICIATPKKPLFPWNCTYSPTAYLYSTVRWSVCMPASISDSYTMYVLTFYATVHISQNAPVCAHDFLQCLLRARVVQTYPLSSQIFCAGKYLTQMWKCRYMWKGS